MTTERVDGETPSGGEYALLTYVKLDTLEEVDIEKADGMVVAEYDGDGNWLCETVGTVKA